MNSKLADFDTDSLKPKVVLIETSYLAFKNNVYLVVDPVSRQAVIIDPAWQLTDIEQSLINYQAELKGILVTHAHPDHIHLVEPLSERHHCPIWMSKEEMSLSTIQSRRLRPLSTEPWQVGQMTIQPLFTPGHTKGSVCYLINGNLFTGDTLFAEGCGLCNDVQSAYSLFGSIDYSLKVVFRFIEKVFSFSHPAHCHHRLGSSRYEGKNTSSRKRIIEP